MNSIFFSAVSAVINKLKDFYEGSLLKKIVCAVCSFFEKLLNSSLIMKFLRSDFLNGQFWRNSVIFKILSWPVVALGRFADKMNTKITAVKETSVLCGFFANLAFIPIRQFGWLLLAMSLGAIPTALIANKPLFWIPPIVALILCLIPASAANIVKSSLITKLIGNSFFGESDFKENEEYHLRKPIAAIILCFISGSVLGLSSPLLTLLVFFGIIAVGAILAKFEIGVYLTVALIPFAPTMALVALIALTLVAFALRLATDKNYEYRVTSFSLPLILFILMTVISTVFSVSFMSSLKIALVYCVFTLFFILFVNTVRTERQWKNVIYLLVFCGLFVSLYGIFQNFFITSTTSSWVDSENFEDISTRVYSTFSNPNVLGQYFILIIPIAFGLMWTKMKEWQRFVNLAVNIAMFLCLLFTWSRGAWLGVLIAIAFFILKKDKFWLTMSLLVILVVPSVLPASILNRFTSIGDTSDSSTAYRIAIWTASFRLLCDNFLTGIGIGSDAFLTAYPEYALSGAEFALHSHSFYFQWLVEMGIGGIVTFAAIIACAFKQIVNAGRQSKFIRTLLLAMGCAMLGWLFQGIVENLWYNYRMLLFFWLYMALIQTGSNISRGDSGYTLR